MNTYTVVATVVAAATMASVAFADLTLSHGQVVKSGQSSVTLCSLMHSCSAMLSRVEHAPAGGVRVAASKACCPVVDQAKAVTCTMSAGCGSKCGM